MSMTKRRYGRKIGSGALTADAWHDMVDILSGATALVAGGITLSDPVRFPAADHLVGSAVGLIVIFVGLGVARDTTPQLIGTMPHPGPLARIRQSPSSAPLPPA